MIKLNVPFVEKDRVKQLGARWHAKLKFWFVPTGIDVAPFKKWLPPVKEVKGDKEEFSLYEFLCQISTVVNEHIPAAEWISAEISEMRQNNNGHIYLTLIEHDHQCNVVARVNAIIWGHLSEYILTKFERGAGSKLESGIKVLVQARVEFHVQYGFALFIDDLDPAYTLGDMAAKLVKIRKILTQEKIINRNKQLPRPVEFTKVAVISPQEAAGLGDFKREAKLLMRHNLCEFVFFAATFQGSSAAANIVAEINEIIKEHKKNSFDALVIIRGGGALADLAWLNDEKLARAICLAPMHVMTGVGHERDSTIIDEVAGEKFDTPSKVSHRIFHLITKNALDAEQNMLSIKKSTQHCVQYYEQIICRLQQSICQLSSQQFTLAQQQITTLYDIVASYAQLACKTAEQRSEALIREILSQDPQRALNKGFTMVTDMLGKILTSKKQAMQHTKLHINFHDGELVTQPISKGKQSE